MDRFRAARPSPLRDGREPAKAPPWHALPVAKVLETLGTSEDGLPPEEAAERLRRFGPNVLPAPPGRSILAIVLGQLRSPLIHLLLAAALISLWLRQFDDAGFIVLVLAINTAIGAIQEWRAEANTAALRSAIHTASRVMRGGTVERIDAAGLVPGDFVLLEAGERVPADLRLLKSADLQTNETTLTGESLPVDKAALETLAPETPLADRLTMLFAGTTVQRGRAEGVVVGTGRGTEIGRIAQTLEEPSSAPPLTRRLERFTRILGTVSLLLVAGIVMLELLRGDDLQETFFVAVALAVSIIPEGLPVAVTVALSVATRNMARRNVIVRHLPAVEGLGACTVIATDKTGTLTVNQLTAKCVWLPGSGAVEVGGEGLSVEGGFTRGGLPLHEEHHPSLRSLGISSALCNDANFDPAAGGDGGASGDTVDLAFLVLAAKAALDVARLRRDHPRVAEIPFAAERKLAASLNRHERAHHLHVKGAAEVVVPLCHGQDNAAALTAAESMAARGYRVLAVATKRVEGDASGEWLLRDEDLGGLTLLGLVGFIDPLRPEAKEAVARCRGAGIAVKMITGDHPATALAIARELGIAESPREVATGRGLADLSGEPERIAALVSAAAVFARVEPAQKMQIVDALQASGHVVAMTGDGVNDAPALHRADLGVAMGLGGTDVARDASDLVLADDNFASIVAGVEEGRAAYANIRKVIYLLISTGAAEVVVFLLAVATGLPVPLTAIQLLWLNLVTNGGQDVALAFERREPGLLDRPPRSPAEAIFDRLMIRQVALSGIYTGAVAYLFFAWLIGRGMGEFEARNLLLFLMVAFENVHVFNCRSEHRSAFRIPLRDNWPLLVAVAGAQAVHIGAAFLPGLRDVLAIRPISVEMWLLLVPIAGSVLLVMEADKRLRGRRA
ncbi:cation-translocating P-type ATPase [Microvirga thermotolerans]|uniref:HAD-IC family P-type ATPase n=1 Tax=Microvirga thermotolerans TaxID=2651334 RepID=A0A5P9JVL6_9HYPH|nr:HAD-IC family P-type ATPase [Microvirga thermotolerans]QFU16647.1 HAD-IC family P-type ATPase [Microvirga thermotolerans]